MRQVIDPQLQFGAQDIAYLTLAERFLARARDAAARLQLARGPAGRAR